MDRTIVIENKTKPVAPIRARFCESFGARLKGFTFRKELTADEGLVLVEKRDSRMDTAIHMLFVWTDLAVFWVDSNFIIVDAVLAKSWAPAYVPKSAARYVIEIHPNRIGDFKIGDQVVFKDA
jgi:uncharacterized membrane protein (UPF0127 family)